MKLTSLQKDRAAGVLLGQAIGDALGVPYEFGPRIEPGHAQMIGGGLGPYAPGEWSDDTQMAVCIAEVTASGADVTTEASWGMTGEKARQSALAGVDFGSGGALTHSVRAVDMARDVKVAAARRSRKGAPLPGGSASRRSSSEPASPV